MNKISTRVYTHTISIKDGKEVNHVRITHDEATNAMIAWDKWRAVPVPMQAHPDRKPWYASPTKIDAITPIVKPVYEAPRIAEPELTKVEKQDRKVAFKRIREEYQKRNPPEPSEKTTQKRVPTSAEQQEFRKQQQELLKKYPNLRKYQK